MEIVKETGQTNISFNNVTGLMDLHGKIIGAVHSIVPIEKDISNPTNKENSEIVYKHITKFFFATGYVHTCSGFSLGWNDQYSEEKLIKVSGLQIILSTILGLAPIVADNLLMELGIDNNSIKLLEEKKTIHFLFQIPVFARNENVLNSMGNSAYENLKEMLEEYDEIIIEILEENKENE